MIALIVPVRDHWDFVVRTVESGARHTPDAHVIVVDDASTHWDDALPRRLASLVPEGRLVVHRFEKHGGLTRSWNTGLRYARELGCAFAVPANSDLVFSPGWWPPLERLLASREASFVGPLTNAPGHQKEQDVRRVVRRYETDDTDAGIAACGAGLRATHGGQWAPPKKKTLNGFLVAGATTDFFALALGDDPFDPRIPFDGNEDDLLARAQKSGRTLGIVLDSFVFHYKGVSRDTAPKWKQFARGAVRPAHALRPLADVPLAAQPPRVVVIR